MRVDKRILTLACAAVAVCALTLAQTPPPPPPPPGADAARNAEAELKARQAEERARQAEKQAQYKVQQAEEKARQVEEKAREIEMKVRVMQKKPRLGVVVNTDANEETDPVGALLTGVTPGGAAEEAGVQAGDIVVRFNGKPVAGKNPEADEDESPAGLRLLEFAKEMKEGEKVTLEVRRGKETKSYTFSPRALGPQTWVFRDGQIPGLEGLKDLKDLEKLKELENLEIDIPDIPEILMLHGGGRLDMEMVSLNPQLGEYFGTTEGILVVRAPKDPAMKLLGGDVILKIGDRVPKSPSQAMRILSSYEAGETVNIEVMRKQKKQPVTFKMPESKDHLQWTDEDGVEHKSFLNFSEDGPAPPAAPSAPMPPEPPAGKA